MNLLVVANIVNRVLILKYDQSSRSLIHGFHSIEFSSFFLFLFCVSCQPYENQLREAGGCGGDGRPLSLTATLHVAAQEESEGAHIGK